MVEENMVSIEELFESKEFKIEPLIDATQETTNLINYIVEKNGVINIQELFEAIHVSEDSLNESLLGLSKEASSLEQKMNEYTLAINGVVGDMNSADNWLSIERNQVRIELSDILSMGNMNQLPHYVTEEEEDEFI